MVSTDAKVYVAGHTGLVGSAIVRCLQSRGYRNLIQIPRGELDLTDQASVIDFFAQERPQLVYVAAARVGGIYANSQYAAEFIRDNLLMQTNIIDSAHRFGASKLLFLSSSCAYPKHATNPIVEGELLKGPLEPTNEWYAIAKIAGVKMCQAYRKQYGFNAISAIPTNLYGPGDNFDLQTSHVLPALLRKIHEAKQEKREAVTVWGSGSPMREFLYVDDLGDACVHLMENYDSGEPVNIGTGEDLTIKDLALLIADIVGFEGRFDFDTSKPDGTPRKLLDVSRVQESGWSASTSLRDGIARTYDWYVEHHC